jgi:hypothetical protein
VEPVTVLLVTLLKAQPEFEACFFFTTGRPPWIDHEQ